jgi:predicted Fe-Mo cluster-binding NifX family protein
MRIAVASADGRNVAPHLKDAKSFLIFQVDGDCIGAFISRRAPESDSAIPAPDASAYVAAMLPAIADCNFLLVGDISPEECSCCARVGIVALPVSGVEHGRDAVEVVVTGKLKRVADCHSAGASLAL